MYSPAAAVVLFSFEDLGILIRQLQQLKQLRHLRLNGCPVALVRGYREAVLTAMPYLESLDGIVIKPEQREELEEAKYDAEAAAAAAVEVATTVAKVTGVVTPAAVGGGEAGDDDGGKGKAAAKGKAKKGKKGKGKGGGYRCAPACRCHRQWLRLYNHGLLCMFVNIVLCEPCHEHRT